MKYRIAWSLDSDISSAITTNSLQAALQAAELPFKRGELDVRIDLDQQGRQIRWALMAKRRRHEAMKVTQFGEEMLAEEVHGIGRRKQ